MKYEKLGEFQVGEMVEVKARETKGGETVGPHLKVDSRRFLWFFGYFIGYFIGCFLVMERSVVNGSKS
jgi:hypothetical protein